ncbi:MAG TPA: MGMT family protein, partial [Candidatus Limnocylindria bacterium]|nr:MGMT family protein [Candidatus Limnocylindria bacterium]
MAVRMIHTPLGLMRAEEDGGSLVSLVFVPGAEGLPGGDETPLLARLEAQLSEYFAGERTEFDLPLDPKGTPFMKAVWARLSGIPYGQTTSYGRLAADAG